MNDQTSKIRKQIQLQIMEAQAIMLECGELLRRQSIALREAQRLLNSGEEDKQKGES
jgi:hypothetical protein